MRATRLRRGYGMPSKLSEAGKFDLQQYIPRCYGSLTTFNILFKNKDDQFRTQRRGQAERLNGQPEGRECGDAVE